MRSNSYCYYGKNKNPTLGPFFEIMLSPNYSGEITLYSDTSETLTFNLPDLLFAQADDNYSTIYFKQGQYIQKKLLRINLKGLESQIRNPFTIRCHRSYLIHVNAVSSITGNSNGYRLQILTTDYFIPVSRSKGKEVVFKIHQLGNVKK